MFRLLIVVLVVACGFAPTTLHAEDVALNAESAIRYIESCRKANGAFGPIDQEYTDLAWNYPAVGALSLLGRDEPPDSKVLQHGLNSPAGHGGGGHFQFF